MNLPLTINDLREWLKENASRYHQQKAGEYPPQEEGKFFELDRFYTTYGELYTFIQYYQFKSTSDDALKELLSGNLEDFEHLGNWAGKYERLGSEDLLVFDGIEYLWDEEEVVKISKDIYTYKEPFLNMLCFCRVFQLLYWDYRLHETIPIETEKKQIVIALRKIIKENYKG